MDIFSAINDYNRTQNVYDDSSLHKQKNEAHPKVDKDKEKEIEELQKREDKEKVKKELEKTVEELNKVMDPLSADIKFQFNSKADELTVKVVDKNTDRVIREFPPKEALHLMEKMRELVGILFDKKG